MENIICRKIPALGKFWDLKNSRTKSIIIFSRRFSDSFEKLRLERVQIQRSRNPEKLNEFETQLFEWPAKEDDPDPGLGGDILGDHPHAADGDRQEPVLVGVLGPIAALNAGIIRCPEIAF